MTVKLYDKDAYIKEFTATVLSCEETDGAYQVVLDETAFFPEGGGQPADTGTLGEVNVKDVQEEKGIIVHITDGALPVGEKVSGKLNWDIRYSRMQSHAGEHIVAGTVHTMFGYDNVGFHLNDSFMTVDVSGPLTKEDIGRDAFLERAWEWTHEYGGTIVNQRNIPLNGGSGGVRVSQ